MAKILVPSRGAADWQALLAEPDKHWKAGRSARTLAHCWEDARGFPPEVKAILATAEPLVTAEPLLVIPEWQVPLPGGSRPSQNDVWVLAKACADLISIAVEGKVDEPFGPTVGEWQAEASPGKDGRLAFLQDVLGLGSAPGSGIRYQLLHRAASAVIEAQRFGARHAVMLVHSFSPDNRWFEDFSAFVSLFGKQCPMGRLVQAAAMGGLQLHLGWVRGDERFLEQIEERATPLLSGDLVLDAMRIAEWAHRARYRKAGVHYRKAPEGRDRPSYFLHLSQVAWMLESAGMDAETVAAGYLHDTFEDTTLSREELLEMLGDTRVVELIEHVTEPPKADDGKGDWEMRNAEYLKRIRSAPPEAIALSCTDKTANLIDFALLMRKGHPIETFASRGFRTQLSKFEGLSEVFRAADVPGILKDRFERALIGFKLAGERLP